MRLVHVSFVVLLVWLISLSACDSGPNSTDDLEGVVASPFVSATVETGGAGDPTHWSAMSAEELWKHIAALDSTVTVGLKENRERKGVSDRGRVLVSKSRWRSLGQRVETLGAELLSVDEFLPLVELRLSGVNQIRALRRSPFVEYVEPASFDPAGTLMSPCGPSPPRRTGQTMSPGDIVPYTLEKHGVPDAWALSTGSGTTIGIVDTGISVYQPQVQGRFGTGLSAGRTITYDWSDPNPDRPEPYHDSCGHGTKTLALATAPRDGQNIVGVAYQANAYAVRALDSPLGGPGQWGEIREGVRRAALNADIVSMSFGWSWGNSSVASTIRQYYYNPKPSTNRRVLFIAAAGSDTQWLGNVSFPADMDEVVAITGTFNGATPCDGCNYGTQVEFAAYTTGETAGSNSGGVGDIDGVAKTSGAAPLVAGIAALVWSRYPDWSRDQVLQRMREKSSRAGNRDTKIGYGIIDALEAVGGHHPLTVAVGGPSNVYESGPYTFEAMLNGGVGPFTYRWLNDGSTSPSLALFLQTRPSAYTETVSVSVYDQGTATTSSASLDIFVHGSSDGGCGAVVC